jgi:hypothetical protein
MISALALENLTCIKRFDGAKGLSRVQAGMGRCTRREPRTVEAILKCRSRSKVEVSWFVPLLSL